jgi:tetratricopeptide (TPR) repeat protein
MHTTVRICYCQKCKTANPLGADSCGRCGTRLMLVVEPPASRFEGGGFISLGEENLFERVTLLELRLGQVLEKVGKTLDLLLQQSRNQHFDHTLLETVVEALAAGGVVSGSDLRSAWQRKRLREAGENAESRRRERLRVEAPLFFRGQDLAEFSREIERGLKCLADGHPRKGLAVLERLAAAEPKNSALNHFLGEHFFILRKTTLARSYLTAAHRASPADAKICLLLGLTLAAEGELRRAGELLQVARGTATERVAAQLGLGWIAVAERNWSGALNEFRAAAAGRKQVELNHVLAAVYYQLERYRLAEKQISKYLDQSRPTESVMRLLAAVKFQLSHYPASREAYLSAYQLREQLTGKRAKPTSDFSFPRPPELAPIFQQYSRTRRCLIVASQSELGDFIRSEALKDVKPKADMPEMLGNPQDHGGLTSRR